MITRAEVFEDEVEKRRKERRNAALNRLLAASLRTRTKEDVLCALFGAGEEKPKNRRKTWEKELVL